MAIYLIDYENTGVKGLAGIEKLSEEDQIILFYGPKTGSIPFDEHVKISQSASHVEYIKTTKTAKNYLDFQLTTYLGYLIASTPVREYHVVSKDSGYDSVVDFWSKKGLVIKRQDTVAGAQKAAAQTKNASAGTKNRKKQQNRKQESLKQENTKQIQTQQIHEQELTVQETNVQESPESDLREVQPAEKGGSQAEEESREKETPMPLSVPESVRKKIRAVLKTENLQGGVYKQIYACMLSARDKQTFNTALVRAFTQEKGNHYYKTLVQIFQEWKQKG